MVINRMPLSSFNSKMVRLKATRFFDRQIGVLLFQFQNGAIKRFMAGSLPLSISLVSIPKWCD